MTSEPLEVRTYQFYSEVNLPVPPDLINLKSLRAQRHKSDPAGVVRLVYNYEDGPFNVKFCRRIGKPDEQGFYKCGAFPTKELNYTLHPNLEHLGYFERESQEVKIFEMLTEQPK